jgi:hypothetical protein
MFILGPGTKEVSLVVVVMVVVRLAKLTGNTRAFRTNKVRVLIHD